jgi:hypothetical protein
MCAFDNNWRTRRGSSDCATNFSPSSETTSNCPPPSAYIDAAPLCGTSVTCRRYGKSAQRLSFILWCCRHRFAAQSSHRSRNNAASGRGPVRFRWPIIHLAGTSLSPFREYMSGSRAGPRSFRRDSELLLARPLRAVELRDDRSAEGLGKPVIYLCKRSVFDDQKRRPHFDTNHHLTIPWEPETAVEDMVSLKATVRFSIPEARPIDP